MPRLTLVNYAGAQDPALNARLLAAQAAQNASAGRAGIDRIISWNREKLKATRFYEENREILDRPRGGGYWLWKPYIILEALKEAEPEDVIVYYDVGRLNPFTFTGPIDTLVKWCLKHDGILPGVPIGPQGQWTKRDCFHYMGCDSPRFWQGTQIQATFSLWSGARAIEIVSEWLLWCKDRRCLTDDPNECGLPNLPGCRGHRHDQSILGNLRIKKRCRALPISLVPKEHSKDINRWAAALIPVRLSTSPHQLDGWIGVGVSTLPADHY